MNPQLNLHTETLNDIPLLLDLIDQMGIRKQIDAQIKPHGQWAGISVGTVVSIWLCYLLTTGDHRLVAIRDWVAEHERLFNEGLGIQLRATDCSDDRLAQLLTLFGKAGVQMALD